MGRRHIKVSRSPRSRSARPTWWFGPSTSAHQLATGLVLKVVNPPACFMATITYMHMEPPSSQIR